MREWRSTPKIFALGILLFASSAIAQSSDANPVFPGVGGMGGGFGGMGGMIPPEAAKGCEELGGPTVLGGSSSEFLKHMDAIQAKLKEEAQTCRRVGVGGKVIVDFPLELSPTGVRAAYRLRRPEADLYQVDVRINFLKAAPSTAQNFLAGSLSPFDPEVQKKFSDKVSRCLKNTKGALRGPRGERLEVRLSEDRDVPVSVVNVVEAGQRADASSYPENIDCPTVAHEVMHLLGLCDEYHESSFGFHYQAEMNEIIRKEHGASILGFDCRARGPASSLMNDHWAVVKAMRQEEFEVVYCSCPPGSDCARLAADSRDREECPSGLKRRQSRLVETDGVATNLEKVNPPTLWEDGLDGGYFALPRSRKFLKVTEAQIPSALMPAHFRAITEPGCRDVNEIYYSCSKNAYKSSGRQFPPGAIAGWAIGPVGCDTVPAACSDPNSWLQ